MRIALLTASLCLASVSHAGILEEALATEEAKPYVPDPVAAEKAYFRGANEQAKRHWAKAIEEYKASLDADHDYIWSNKALGTAYLQAGDKWAALTNYEIYLKANPDDAQMRSFTNKLRVELGEAPVVAEVQELEEDPSGAKTRLFVGGGLGALLAGADDLNSLSAGAKYNGALALGLDAAADYHFKGGYVGGARILFGPNRSHSTDGAVKTTTDISHFGIFVAPGMRLPKSKKEWWDLRVGLGFLSTSVTSTTNLSGSNVTRTLTGSGLGLWPEVGYARTFDKRIEGMVSLGYLLSSESVTDSTGKAFNLGTGGLSARLGLYYHI